MVKSRQRIHAAPRKGSLPHEAQRSGAGGTAESVCITSAHRLQMGPFLWAPCLPWTVGTGSISGVAIKIPTSGTSFTGKVTSNAMDRGTCSVSGITPFWQLALGPSSALPLKSTPASTVLDSWCITPTDKEHNNDVLHRHRAPFPRTAKQARGQ